MTSAAEKPGNVKQVYLGWKRAVYSLPAPSISPPFPYFVKNFNNETTLTKSYCGYKHKCNFALQIHYRCVCSGHCTLPLYGMHCTLTQFNWTTHTHCTNTTTYLLPLDTIQRTSTLCIRPMYNLLHLHILLCIYVYIM